MTFFFNILIQFRLPLPLTAARRHIHHFLLFSFLPSLPFPLSPLNLIFRWAVSTVMTRQNIIPVVSRSTTSTTKGSQQQGDDDTQTTNGSSSQQEEEGEDERSRISSKKLHALIPLWDLCNHEDGRVRKRGEGIKRHSE